MRLLVNALAIVGALALAGAAYVYARGWTPSTFVQMCSVFGLAAPSYSGLEAGLEREPAAPRVSMTVESAKLPHAGSLVADAFVKVSNVGSERADTEVECRFERQGSGELIDLGRTPVFDLRPSETRTVEVNGVTNGAAFQVSCQLGSVRRVY